MQFFRWATPDPITAEKLSSNAGPHGGECGQRNAVFHVHWVWPGTDGAYFPLACHGDSPTLDLNEDYVGPLCIEELSLIRGKDSSRCLNPQWIFEITAL